MASRVDGPRASSRLERLDAYRGAYLYLSHHGGATCTEADPNCQKCPLLDECRFGQNGGFGAN